MKTKQLRFLSDNSGATIIEFAFVFPVFLLMILGSLEFAIVFYLRGTIEEVTRSVARLSITGSTYDDASGQSRGEFLNQQLHDSLNNVVFKPGNLTVMTDVYDTFHSTTGASTQSSNGGPVSFGAENQIIEYTVIYEHDFLTPVASLANALNPTLTITSTAFGQNENF